MEVDEELIVAEEDIIEKIRRFIMKRAGLYFKEHDMPFLRENITERMAAAKTPTALEYYNLLTESPQGPLDKKSYVTGQAHKEFTELLNLLTIKHTHYFRSPDQFIGLRDNILPEITEKKTKVGDMSLNILCAGCATGEEPYSIAMMLLDILGQQGPWKVGILATDISTEALVFAKKGIYPESVLQHIEKDFIKQYMEKYCLIHKDKVFVSPAIKNMVEFQYMNLVDEYLPQGFDIIFCRNVTIYFEIETTKTVIERFYQSLNEGGYLFSGGTETMYGISDKFELVDIDHAMVYKKIPAKELRPAEEKVWPWQPAVTYPVSEKEPVIPEKVEKKPVEPAKSLKEAHALYEKAKIAFIKKDYMQAEDLAKSALEIESNLEQGRILLANIFVNQDRFQEAERECQKSIDINFLSSQARYLLGLIHKKRSQYKEALDNLRKAIYLNANFSLAHFTLAELYREKALAQEAQKAYKNTLKALEKEPEEDFRESSGGLSKKILAQVCVRGMKEMLSAR